MTAKWMAAVTEEADLANQLRALKATIDRLEAERREVAARYQEQLHVLRGQANTVSLRLQKMRMKK